MIIRGTDENGDLQLGQGLGNYLKESQAIQFNIRTRLLEWKRDCPWGLSNGVDWRSHIGAKYDITVITAQIKSVILGSYGLLDLVAFNSTINTVTRELNIAFTYIDIYNKSNELIINPYL